MVNENETESIQNRQRELKDNHFWSIRLKRIMNNLIHLHRIRPRIDLVLVYRIS